MVDISVALEALGALCTENQEQASPINSSSRNLGPQQTLSSKLLISTVLDGDENWSVSISSYPLQSVLDGIGGAATPALKEIYGPIKRNLIMDMDELFDSKYDYDFTRLTDKDIYYRGEEKYERPCGWQRFALRVLDKYPGNNTWLGDMSRTTESCPGEWPVSYHGTSKKGADGIIEDHYKDQGWGIYSTPDISVADSNYAKTFTSKNGKTYKLVLQNRINPEYRKKYKNDLYWLVPIPQGTSKAEEQAMAERAIRPYGLLLKEV